MEVGGLLIISCPVLASNYGPVQATYSVHMLWAIHIHATAGGKHYFAVASQLLRGVPQRPASIIAHSLQHDVLVAPQLHCNIMQHVGNKWDGPQDELFVRPEGPAGERKRPGLLDLLDGA